MDRKRIPTDWRKRLAAARAKISTAFTSLPKDIDPYFQTLDPEGFFHFFSFIELIFCLIVISIFFVSLKVGLLMMKKHSNSHLFFSITCK